jgi:hypothetical protein
MKEYCCESMKIAIESWGGVWWDKDKQCWFIEKEAGGEEKIEKITRCIWCGGSLPETPKEDE